MGKGTRDEVWRGRLNVGRIGLRVATVVVYLCQPVGLILAVGTEIWITYDNHWQFLNPYLQYEVLLSLLVNLVWWAVFIIGVVTNWGTETLQKTIETTPQTVPKSDLIPTFATEDEIKLDNDYDPVEFHETSDTDKFDPRYFDQAFYEPSFYQGRAWASADATGGPCL